MAQKHKHFLLQIFYDTQTFAGEKKQQQKNTLQLRIEVKINGTIEFLELESIALDTQIAILSALAQKLHIVKDVILQNGGSIPSFLD